MKHDTGLTEQVASLEARNAQLRETLARIEDEHAQSRQALFAESRMLEILNGTDAVALFERVRPDVAILDIGMPGLGGNEVGVAVEIGARPH